MTKKHIYVKAIQVLLIIFFLSFISFSLYKFHQKTIQKVSAISSFQMDIDLSNADASYVGESGGDDVGYAVADAGDVNNDGYGDFLIGAYANDDGGSDAGQTYLILGKASGWATGVSAANADASFIGEDADDNSGWDVAGGGDVNNDGFDDFIIGAPYDEEAASNAGQVYLIFGKASGWSMDQDLSTADASFRGEDSNEMAGYDLDIVGDLNNDGFDDIIIGAYGDEEGGAFAAGQTYIIFGKSSGWAMDTSLSTADASYLGEAGSDYSGRTVSAAGDVNNDGFDDFIIGALLNDEVGNASGQTYLILGKSSGWSMDVSLSSVDASFLGEAAENRSGESISDAGDVNGDGYDDIIIGAFNNGEASSMAGQTYIIFGKASGWSMDTSLSTADASYQGEASQDFCGERVSGAGDVNADGYADVLIASTGNDAGGSLAGQSYLILGKSSGWSMDVSLSNADASFIGESADDDSGFPVSRAGDINADGGDDLLIGASGYSGYQGITYVLFAPSYTVTVPAEIDVVLTSDYTTDPSSSGVVGIHEVAVMDDSYVVATLGIDFSSNHDWSSLVAVVGSDSSIFYYPSGFSSLPGRSGSTFNLYVQQGSGNRVGICPNVTSLNQVDENCSGLYYLTESDSNVTVVDISGVSYWRVSGLTENAGGFSSILGALDYLPETGNLPDTSHQGSLQILMFAWSALLIILGIILRNRFLTFINFEKIFTKEVNTTL